MNRKTSLRAMIGDLEVGEGLPVRIMAIVNASPESFYAGSVASGREAVRLAAQRAAEAGADLLDIGAMSTAPYKETWISEEEEADRMAEAVEAAGAAAGLPITADTMRPKPAAAALEAGAAAINDVSGFEQSAATAELVANWGASAIVMAREPQPPTDAHRSLAPGALVEQRLLEALARSDAAGIARERVVLDPGLGFFRGHRVPWYDFDLEQLRALRNLHALGRPLLVSVSRKSLFKKLLGREHPEERLAGSLGAAVWAAMNGAHIVRTHDPAETRDAVRIAELISSGERYGEAVPDR